MPSIPAGVLIMSRSAFLEVMRYACGMFLGKKTIPPSDSSISWSSYQSTAVPLMSMNTSSSRVCLWYGGASPSLTSKRPIINWPSVALPSSNIASVPPSSHSSCCCCSGCARYAMLTRHPHSLSAGHQLAPESVGWATSTSDGREYPCAHECASTLVIPHGRFSMNLGIAEGDASTPHQRNLVTVRRPVAWSSPPCTYGRGSVRAQARSQWHVSISSTCPVHVRKQGWSTQTSFGARAPDAQFALTKIAVWKV